MRLGGGGGVMRPGVGEKLGAEGQWKVILEGPGELRDALIGKLNTDP